MNVLRACFAALIIFAAQVAYGASPSNLSKEELKSKTEIALSTTLPELRSVAISCQIAEGSKISARIVANYDNIYNVGHASAVEALFAATDEIDALRGHRGCQPRIDLPYYDKLRPELIDLGKMLEEEYEREGHS